MYTCGALMSDFKEQGINTSKQAILDQVFVWWNLTCTKPIEALYYSAGYPDRCVHCATDRLLPKDSSSSEYPMCEPCRILRKKEPVLKQKQNRMALPGAKKKK